MAVLSPGRTDRLILPDRNSILVLFSWFEKYGITYPWGERPEPYAVWISEIMLQQTIITTVIPYYERWMKRFPELKSLVQADEQEVLRAWEGLGYYSRARNILKTANIIEVERGGLWPDTVNELARLPGIGPYTAAAIASFSLGMESAVLDANVRRIICRINAFFHWPEKGDLFYREGLSLLLKGREFGLWNGSVMQLGQLVCKNKNPLCRQCPFLKICKGCLSEHPEQYPEKKKKTINVFSSEIIVLVHDNRLLLEKREKGVGRDLWVFPRKEALSVIIPENRSIPLGNFLHNYTNNRENLQPMLVFFKTKPMNPAENMKWFDLHQLEFLPMPSIFRKITNKAVETILSPETLAKKPDLII